MSPTFISNGLIGKSIFILATVPLSIYQFANAIVDKSNMLLTTSDKK